MKRNVIKQVAGSAGKNRIIGFLLTIGLCVISMGIPCHTSFAESAKTATGEPFRLAFSTSMFTETNEVDVRATMKVWIMTVAMDLGIPVDPEPNIQPTVEALAQFGKSHEVDGFALVTPEVALLSKDIKFDRFAVGVRKENLSEEYLLLVRRKGGPERLEQLMRPPIGI